MELQILKNFTFQLKPINSNVRLSLSKSLVAQFVSIRLRQAQLDNSVITNLKNFTFQLKLIDSDVRLSLSKSLVALIFFSKLSVILRKSYQFIPIFIN